MTVVETRPTTLHGWHEEVRRLAADGEFERAIDILERLVDAVPDRRRLQQDLVRLYRQADRPVAADKLAVQLDPGDHREVNGIIRLDRLEDGSVIGDQKDLAQREKRDGSSFPKLDDEASW